MLVYKLFTLNATRVVKSLFSREHFVRKSKLSLTWFFMCMKKGFKVMLISWLKGVVGQFGLPTIGPTVKSSSLHYFVI